VGGSRPLRQLVLPVPLGGDTVAAPSRIPREERVWVNRNLKMSSVQWVGFDMDYTLAIYDQGRMDSLQVDATVERLIQRGYPSVGQADVFALPRREFCLHGTSLTCIHVH